MPVEDGIWQHGSPPGFSIYRRVEMLCIGWGCGGVEFYLFLVVFPAKCISSVSPRFYFRKHAFCFVPLVAILESHFPLLMHPCDLPMVLQSEDFTLLPEYGLSNVPPAGAWHISMPCSLTTISSSFNYLILALSISPFFIVTSSSLIS
jgi:hypothetical protein